MPLKLLLALCSLCIATGFARSASAADDSTSDDPQVERRLLQLPDGFDIQLYASEPDIINPVTMNFDTHGRLWVLCLPGYPHVLPNEQPRDFITVLDSPDANGHASGSHTFATGLNVPTGMIPSGNGAYVGEGDSLIYLADTDGDGRADQRRLIFPGFGTQDLHHTINTFRFGQDGNLYFNQGLYILSSVETPRGLRRHFGGGMWQLNPRTLDLEIYDRALLPTNTWGHVLDEWGRSLTASGWVADINRVLPDTPLNTSNDPEYVPPLPMTKLAGDRHCGLELITGRHFPADFQNNLVSGGFQSQQVNRFTVSDKAGELSVRELPPLVSSRHQKFRPVDVKMGPDGALYIADWYNLIIQHNQVDFRDLRRDHTHGRIWRVVFKSRSLVTPPDLTAPTARVLDYLKDPEQWTRDQARRALAERNPDEIAAALGVWVDAIGHDATDADHQLLEALWLYQSIDVVEPNLLRRLLKVKDPRARSAATTVLGYWHNRIDDSLSLLTQQARDKNSWVRLSAVLAVQRIPSAGAFAAAMNVVNFPADQMMTFELHKAALVLQKYWYPAFKAGALTLDNDPRQISFALIAIRSPGAVPKLLALLNEGKIPPNHQCELLESVAATGNATDIVAVFNAAKSESLNTVDRAVLLRALAETARSRKVIPQTDLTQIAPLMDRDDEIGQAAIALAGAWRIEALRESLQKISQNPATNATRRQAAMNALVELGGDSTRTFLITLASNTNPPTIRTDAIIALAALDLTEASKSASTLFHEPSAADSAAPVFAALLHRKGGPESLLAALQQIKPHPDAARAGLRELTTAGVPFPALADLLRSASMTTNRHRPQPTTQEVQRLVNLSQSSGNPAHGEQLFRSSTLGCMRCHAIAGAGGNVGPDLAAIGTSAQPDFLVEHILEPGKRVKDGFAAYLVETTSGDSFTGVFLRETADALILSDTSHDEIPIPKNTIKKRRPIGTLMPAGLADTIADDELADLVRFLSELGKPGQYKVSPAPLARRWWTPARIPTLPSDPAARGKMLLEDKSLVWSRQFSNVAGYVPLSEVAATPDASVAILRTALDVRTAGHIALSVRPTAGVELYVDGVPTRVGEMVPLDLIQGRHTLDFRLDLAGQNLAGGFSCELVESGTPPGHAIWATN